jgi:hypothetical protein
VSNDLDASILRGAYDLHVHAAPDAVPRAQDAWDLAEAACAAGMAGMLLKDHTTSTVGRCAVLNRRYDGTPRFFSAIALNPPVGLLNPTAVEAALRSGTDAVFFPTYGAAYHVRLIGPTTMNLPIPPGDFAGETVFDEAGELVPTVPEILRLIAEHDAVLATGHLSPAEVLAVLRAGRRAGVRRLLVTHASEIVPGMSVAQQREAVSIGAMIEHCFLPTTPCCPGRVELSEIARQIGEVGPAHVILSSDFGQPDNGPPVRAFADHLAALNDLGFDRRTLRTLIADNPAELMLGR